ncbi:MAG: hypothetical protein JSV42_04620 [Chloroflexota bacterium]|nr:MAG: hypothetical protein JSV42_04620 [Chloroflexota bacterium]
MDRPIKLEIFSLIPISYHQCKHCETFYDQSGIGPQVHQRIMQEYPNEVLEDHLRLSELVVELANRYKNRLEIEVIDPQSGLGFYKSLRYWVREYPTFLLAGEDKITGWDSEKLDDAIQARLSRYYIEKQELYWY